MAAHKGHQKWGGRQKGTLNKVNSDLKSMILGALSAKGGQKYLEKQAEANPIAFMTLVGKVLPMTVVGDETQPLTFQIISGVERLEAEIEAAMDASDETPNRYN
jgi:hypothetical protein